VNLSISGQTAEIVGQNALKKARLKGDSGFFSRGLSRTLLPTLLVGAVSLDGSAARFATVDISTLPLVLVWNTRLASVWSYPALDSSLPSSGAAKSPTVAFWCMGCPRIWLDVRGGPRWFFPRPTALMWCRLDSLHSYFDDSVSLMFLQGIQRALGAYFSRTEHEHLCGASPRCAIIA